MCPKRICLFISIQVKKVFFVLSGASSSWATSTSCGTGDWGIIVQQEQVFPRSETWINLAPLKLLWDLDPALVDLAGDVGAPFGHGPVLGPANVRTYSSPEVLWKHAFSAAGHANHAADQADQLVTSGDAELGASVQRRLHGGAAACLAGGI